MSKPDFTILNGEFSIHRFESSEPVPKEIFESGYFWIGRTDEELSIVCEAGIKLNNSKQDSGWSVIKIIGPFDLTVVGILADISRVLAAAGISIFALSTYDTDYILIKTANKDRSIDALSSAGYNFLKL